MPEEPFLTLERIRDKEKNTNWEDVCENLNDLLSLIERTFVIDAKKIQDLAGVIRSDNEPSASDRDKIWTNVSQPYFFAIFASGEWQKFYQYVQQEEEPSFAVENLVWVKSSEPYALGAYIDGNWRYFYNYQVNVPFRWLIADTKPEGVRATSAQETSDYELPAPTNGKWEWVVFDPPT